MQVYPREYSTKHSRLRFLSRCRQNASNKQKRPFSESNFVIFS